MSLKPGDALGPYEVIGTLGAGGMGEVYRARDTKLGRSVALKVLPDPFASNPERLARFTREAQVLASLNHPNIAAIYGLEGQALVMELVEGDDLSAVIARGPMTLDDALPIARQVADALEAAHESGIVHRDLKPANIKVRADGTVKVLDFGLAKAMDRVLDSGPGTLDAANSPTLTIRGTQMGMILGTAAYMSPEQARGKAVDKRADVWAFGCVLYEMLSGRRPFTGEEVSDVLAAVLRQEIDWTALPANTPADLRRLLMRCLDRDPRTRLRDIGEARVLLSSPLSNLSEPAAATAAPRAAAASRGRNAFLWAAAGLVIGAALVVAAQWIAGGGSGSGVAERSQEFAFQRITNLPGPERNPDISPDGRQVLYTSRAAGNSDIYLLRVGGAHAINLTASATEYDGQARFSPNGDQIVFRSNRDGGGLFLMGATGESVKRLTTAGYDPSWSPDGRRVVYSMEGVDDPYARWIFAELWTVEVATGATSKIYAGDAVQPAWSPDGSRIAYWANTGGQRDIWTIPATGGTPEAITQDLATDWSPTWSPDGRWLYFSSDRGGSMNLWRVRLDQTTGRTVASPEPVTNSVRPIGYARLSSSGTKLIAMGYDATADITVFNFDPSAPDRMTLRTTIRNQAFDQCDPSPDGVWLACTDKGAHEDLVLVRSDGSETRRLMDDAFKDRGPLWSPDGKTLSFYSTRGGRWETWAIQADGSNLRQLSTMDADTGSMVWSPDGRNGIVSAISTRTVWRLDSSRLNSLPSAEMLKDVAEAGLLEVQSWAASGTLVAGSFFPDPLTSVPAVWDLSARTLRKLHVPVRAPQSSVTAFLPDSRRLLISSAGTLLLVDLAGGSPRQLRAGGPFDYYRLSRDGRTLVLMQPVFDSDIWLMELGETGR